MDGFELLLVLAALTFLGGSVLGLISFFWISGLRKQIAQLKTDQSALRAQFDSLETAPSTESPLEETDKPEPTSTEEIQVSDEVTDTVSSRDEEGAQSEQEDQEVSEPQVAAQVAASDMVSEEGRSASAKPAKPEIDTESKIGGKLSIWIGGLTLAIGGLYLVKYSMDAGLLGPTARVTLGFIFGAIIAAASEWTRRRPHHFTLAGFESANIPAILSGAGIFIMFGAIYSAHALYDLIGPTTSFIILAALALASLLISLLHGPILAALGLLASYTVPFLINSDSANIPVLASYVLLVSAAAMYVAWYRAWLWCAIASVVAMFCYGMLMEIGEGDENSVTLLIYMFGTLSITYLSLVWSVHERKPDADMAFDWKPTIALSALFLPILFHFPRDQHIAVHLIELAFLLGLPLAAAFRYPALRLVTIVPAMLSVLKYFTLFSPSDYVSAQWLDLYENAIGPDGKLQLTESIAPYISHSSYMTIGAVIIVALLVFALLVAQKTRSRLVITSMCGAVSLAIFASAYFHIARLDPSTEFALAGMILFALFHLQANYFHQKLDQQLIARDGTIATALVCSLVALALAVSIYLSGVGLTIALGLISAAALVTHLRYPLKGLRIFAVVAVLPYIARLVWEPFIDKPALVEANPFFNLLALGYGIPMVGFIFAAYVATKHKNDLWSQILQAIAITSAVVTVTMLALHAIDPKFEFNSYRTALAGAATLVLIGGAFSLGLTRIAKTGDGLSSLVMRWASEGLGILGMLVGALSLFIALNPMTFRPFYGWVSKDVHLGHGLLFNLLNYAYLLPFILFAVILWQGRETKSQIYQWIALIFTALLGAFWVNLLIRHIFHGYDIATAAITQAENYTYSVVWLLIGILVLYLGIRWRQQLLRKVSGLIILVVVLKAFLIDMSHLEGVLRALSFIGLGGTLMAIGFVYQRALRGMFASTDDASDDLAESEQPES